MTPPTHDTSAPVLVTGATGYVAGWIVARLLGRGFTVHAAVRDPSNRDKLRYLDELAAGTPGTLRYFASDLLEEGSYAEAMRGCRIVFHTASPFTIRVHDPRKDLIEPAQLGTRNVLAQANSTPSVERVVVTSSCAAIYGDNADIQEAEGGTLTEEVWNTTSSPTHQPYSYSKVVAEREAWKIAEAQDRWDLVAVNPSLVLGPAINPFATSESFSIVKSLGDGSTKSGVPDYGMGAVDVRDVADAHLAAAFTPSAAGRYIVSGHDTSLPELAAILRDHYGDSYPLPRRTMPKWLVWLVAPLVDKAMTRKIISRNVGYPFHADPAKSVRELGMSYRPLEESIVEMFQQMVDAGIIETPKAGAWRP
jgi:nucleoside-diphosphate-sugar epimerase